MKVRDLLELLADYDEDAEVRIAHQPNWPLRLELDRIVSSEELADEDENDGFGDDEDNDPKEQLVWLVAGGHPYNESPYAPKSCWANGW